MSKIKEKPARMWQEIAQEASTERDSKKLSDLCEELDHALEERDKILRPKAKRISA